MYVFQVSSHTQLYILTVKGVSDVETATAAANVEYYIIKHL